VRCPKCSHLLSRAAGRCPNCGAFFGAGIEERLADYFALRAEWDELMATSAALNSQLRKIAETIMSLERSIEADLDRAAGPRPETAGQPDAVVNTVMEPASLQDIPEKAPIQGAQRPQRERGPDLADRIKKQLFDPEFRVGQKALLFIGIVTMVFGVAFFLKYSFEQGWIGPAGRVALAYLWGIAFLCTGHAIKQRKFPAFGLSLFGGGIAVLYFATYAAFQIYHLLPQTASFLIMVLITVLACLTAVAYEAQALAILGLIGGFGTPVLLSTGQDNYMVLFSYMTLLNFGILGISFKKRWVVLQYTGFAVTWILFSGWYSQHYNALPGFPNEPSRFWAALAFLNLSYLIYSIVPFAYHFLSRQRHDLKGFYILIPNSLAALAYNYSIIQSRYSTQWVSTITVTYAFLFMFFAFQIYRQGQSQREAFVIMLLKASFFLILTIPLLFSRHWITIFWALQAVVLVFGARKLMRKEFFIMSFVLLFLALIKFTLHDLTQVFGYSLDPSRFSITPSFSFRIVERWLTAFLLIGSLYQFVRLSRDNERGETSTITGSGASSIFTALFGISIFSMMTLEISAFFHSYLPQARFAAISIEWTLFAMVVMVLGFKKNSDVMRKVALGLLFMTVFKVFIFDISRISTPYRILSFIVLGLILILISYLYTKAKQRLLATQTTQEEVKKK